MFVKYDRITERGEGECVTIPIRILERPPDFRSKKTAYNKTGADLVEMQARVPRELKIDAESQKYKDSILSVYEQKWLKDAVQGAELIEVA